MAYQAQRIVLNAAYKGFRCGTEILRVPSLAASCSRVSGSPGTPSARPAFHVILLPGNPGQAHFYVPFMNYLQHKLPNADIWAITYLGFDGVGLTPATETFSLQDQVQHKIDVIQSLREHEEYRELFVKDGGRQLVPVTLIGHSIGAWVCCEMVARASWLRSTVTSLIALMPFFQVNATCGRQSFLRRLTGYYVQLGWLAAVLGSFPNRARKLLVQAYSPTMCSHAVEAVARMIHPTVVRNGFYLGACEFEELQFEYDWTKVPSSYTTFAAFCAPNDIWLPKTLYEEMVSRLPGVYVRLIDDQVHAFCVSQEKSRLLAESVSTVLQEALKP